MHILQTSRVNSRYKVYFLRTHKNITDVICDEDYNSSFYEKPEFLQYNPWLTITGAMRGTSSDKIYYKLGLEPLKFYKIFTKKSLLYLFDLITNLDRAHNTRLSDNISAINVRYDCN